MKKVTEPLFLQVKGGLFNKFAKPYRLAAKYDLSLKTIYQIRGSRTFAEYTQQNKAQHPEVQYSLAENVLNLHMIVFNKHDNKYIAPPTARKACEELKRHFIKLNREK